MACFHPLKAFQTEEGDIYFYERVGVCRELTLPCGRCIGCRLVRSRSWAIRIVHEAKCHSVNSFVTLTYDNDNVFSGYCDSCELFIPRGSLHYCDFQKFMKRLRKQFGFVRFFVCGEYGEEDHAGVNRYVKTFSGVDTTLLRPHFHCILFGVGFRDGKKIGDSNGEVLYRSPTLERLWPFGLSSFGSVTFQSAGYVARYATKKITGDMAKEYYKRVDLDTGELVDVVPEFGHMSLKPGVGYPWFVRFYGDVYAARDGVIVSGKKLPAPKYYDRLLALRDPGLSSDKEYDRYVNSERFAADCTPERLAVREICAQARLDMKRRGEL